MPGPTCEDGDRRLRAGLADDELAQLREVLGRLEANAGER